MKSQTSAFLLRCVAILACSSLAISQAAPCDVCFRLNNPLALPHPKAIDIAVATRTAIEKGIIREGKLVSAATIRKGSTGFIAPRRITAGQLVKTWSAQLKLQGNKSQSIAVHVLFVDSGEAIGMNVRSGAIFMQSKLSAKSDVRLVTTKIVLQALVRGDLTVRRALKAELILIEGNNADLTAIVE